MWCSNETGHLPRPAARFLVLVAQCRLQQKASRELRRGYEVAVGDEQAANGRQRIIASFQDPSRVRIECLASMVRHNQSSFSWQTPRGELPTVCGSHKDLRTSICLPLTYCSSPSLRIRKTLMKAETVTASTDARDAIAEASTINSFSTHLDQESIDDLTCMRPTSQGQRLVRSAWSRTLAFQLCRIASRTNQHGLTNHGMPQFSAE